MTTRNHLALGVVAALALTGAPAALAVESVEPITIVINQSPWFKGFAGLIDYYEETIEIPMGLEVSQN